MKCREQCRSLTYLILTIAALLIAPLQAQAAIVYQNAASTGTNSQPNALTVDPSGNVWVANYASNSIQRFSQSLDLSLTVTDTSTRLTKPTGIASLFSGDVIVTNAAPATSSISDVIYMRSSGTFWEAQLPNMNIAAQDVATYGTGICITGTGFFNTSGTTPLTPGGVGFTPLGYLHPLLGVPTLDRDYPPFAHVWGNVTLDRDKPTSIATARASPFVIRGNADGVEFFEMQLDVTLDSDNNDIRQMVRISDNVFLSHKFRVPEITSTKFIVDVAMGNGIDGYAVWERSISKFLITEGYVKTVAVGSTVNSVAVGGSGRVFVLTDNDVAVYDSDLNFLSRFNASKTGATAGRLRTPRGVEVTTLGNIYVADRYSHRVVRWFDPDEWTASGTNTFTDLDLGSQAMTLSAGKNLAVGGVLTLGTNATITVNGGSLQSGTISGDGIVRHLAGSFSPAVGSAIDARYVGSRGTVLTAVGNMAIGKSSRVDGFTTDGELNVGQYEVTLNDANRATLGVLTTLGSGTNPGTITATNGIFIDFDGNLTGRGTVNTTNSAAKASVINGAVVGDSVNDPVVFTGYIKGAGTFDNVRFDGTYSPGLSPTQQFVGNVILGDSATMEMEIGGTAAGSQYDQLISSGTIFLRGNLQVSLLGGYTPSAGDTFRILDGTLVGSFDSVNVPSLINPDWSWDLTKLADNGTLSIVPIRTTIKVVSGVQTQTEAGYAAISGTIPLVKTGDGTLLLNQINTFTGTTSIQQGVLAIANSSAISDSPLVSLTSGASFDVSGLSGGYTVSSGQTIAGSGTVLGSVTFGRGSTLSPGMLFAASGAGMLAADMQAGSLQPLVVPEPATLGMVGVGLGFLGLGALRRKRVA